MKLPVQKDDESTFKPLAQSPRVRQLRRSPSHTYKARKETPPPFARATPLSAQDKVLSLQLLGRPQ